MFENENYNSENLEQNHYQEPPLGDTSSNGTYRPEKVSVPTQNANGLILGKFKSVDDLSKAYIELQKKYGFQAQEIGDLRKLADEYAAHQEKCRLSREKLSEFQEFIQNLNGKYDTEDYLKNREFREIFKAAYDGYGNKLDVDSLVNMLENYINSRSSIAKHKDAIKSEADSATDMLAYSSAPGKFKSAPKKRLTDMSPEELNKALDELM